MSHVKVTVVTAALKLERKNETLHYINAYVRRVCCAYTYIFGI